MTKRNERIAKELQEARAFLKMFLRDEKKAGHLLTLNAVGDLMDCMGKSIDELVDSET